MGTTEQNSRKPLKCPQCGHRPVGTILYGLPDFSEELQAELRDGRTVLGGCCVEPEHDSTWECSKCGWQGHRQREDDV